MKSFGRWLLWVALAGVALQLFFVARIALMLVVAPESTAFMRSEIWRIAEQRVEGRGTWHWSSEWVPYDKISPNLKRAVMASEDAGFTSHGGVDWDAIESAWAKNEKRQDIAERAAARRPNVRPNSLPNGPMPRRVPTPVRPACKQPRSRSR